VQREAEESQRKMIEANGIAAFQRTVSQGISDSYLRWQGINATLALAQSANAKVVIIGSGRDGLPIILGNLDGPTAGTGAQPGGETKPPTAAAPGTETPPGRPGPNGGMPSSRPLAGSESGPAGVSDGSSPSANGPNARSDAAGNSPGGPPDASNRSVLQDVQSVLSRIYGAVRGPSGTGPESNP
jgi:prohibitin 2